MRYLVFLSALFLMVAMGIADSRSVGAVDTIPAGDDHYETSAPASYNPGALGLGFFAPGSDPFSAFIPVRGQPINMATMGTTDTIVRRLGSGFVPPPYPAMAPVPIEIVALNLVSVNPITVTYTGGMNPEPWNVSVTVSPIGGPSLGTTTITKSSAAGGTYTSNFQVRARFTFTRVSDSLTKVQEPVVLPMNGSSSQWEHVCNPGAVGATDFCPMMTDPPVTRVMVFWSGASAIHRAVGACFDVDVDGVLDCFDNCPVTFNPLQTDTDGDGIGDDCDPTPNGDIPPGVLRLETVDPSDAAPGPIPANFFAPGSQPYTGDIVMGGDPGDVTDTVIQRLGYGNFSGSLPSQHVIPIEIVALHLVSAMPITVNYGGPTETWNVTLGLSNVQPSVGTMTVTKTSANGGTFDSQFLIQPKFTFTRISDSLTKIWEPPNIQPYTMSGTSIPWVFTCGTNAIPDPYMCLPFQVAGHAIQDNQVPNFANQRVRQACTDPDVDDVSNCVDNCPTVANANQANQDGDLLGDACEASGCETLVDYWPIPASDPDCDGFTTAAETYVGTDPTSPTGHCAANGGSHNEPNPDRWAADFDDNQMATTLDLVVYVTALNTATGNPNYVQRADLNGNGSITTLDLVAYVYMLNKKCVL